jgi:small subunit ribosomal protein S30e
MVERKKSTGHKKKGTHGSLTKAGKVRDSTPQIRPSVKKDKSGPRIRNKKRFNRLKETLRKQKQKRRVI